ncbi:MAG: hypothetical protein LBJ62_07775 [Bifidobacteriaceae bacterium]|nr:hypothetical protein [Bifidobacteriaceae bacterium]
MRRPAAGRSAILAATRTVFAQPRRTWRTPLSWDSAGRHSPPQRRQLIPPGLLGAMILSLAAQCVVPDVKIAASAPSCATISPGLARLGVYLDLVASDAACPGGAFSFAPGAAQAHILVLTLTINTLVALLVQVATSYGLWAWLRRLARLAAAWLRRKARWTMPSPSFPASARLRQWPHRTRSIHRYRVYWVTGWLRGPPLLAA